ncbi:44161_t:CDS:1, partial [Gigaspora margarita]
ERKCLIEKSGSLITSMMKYTTNKTNYSEELTPEMSIRKSTKLYTTTTMVTPSNDERPDIRNV